MVILLKALWINIEKHRDNLKITRNKTKELLLNSTAMLKIMLKKDKIQRTKHQPKLCQCLKWLEFQELFAKKWWRMPIDTWMQNIGWWKGCLWQESFVGQKRKNTDKEGPSKQKASTNYINGRFGWSSWNWGSKRNSAKSGDMMCRMFK